MLATQNRFCLGPKQYFSEPGPNSNISYSVGGVVCVQGKAFRITGEALYEWVGNTCFISWPVIEVPVSSLPATLTKARD